jgi:hypothetical protein
MAINLKMKQKSIDVGDKLTSPNIKYAVVVGVTNITTRLSFVPA